MDGVGCEVEQMFCFIWRRFPFTVAIDLVRCFLTMSADSPSQVVKISALIASIQVEGTRLNAALWRYATISHFFLYFYTLFAINNGGDGHGGFGKRFCS